MKCFIRSLLIFLFCFTYLQGATKIKDEEIYFENGSMVHAAQLLNLAMRANDTYRYRSVSDQQAIKVFSVHPDHFRGGIIRMMKHKGQLMGFFGLTRFKENNGREINVLSHLFLDPKFIGKGHGKKLFQEAMRVAKDELKWDALEWESDPFAAWFYRKMGAKQIGINICPLNPSYKAPVFVYIL